MESVPIEVLIAELTASCPVNGIRPKPSRGCAALCHRASEIAETQAASHPARLMDEPELTRAELDDHFLSRAEVQAAHLSQMRLKRLWGKTIMPGELGVPVKRMSRYVFRRRGLLDHKPHDIGMMVLHWLTVLARYTEGDFDHARDALKLAYADCRSYCSKLSFKENPHSWHPGLYPSYLTIDDIWNAVQLVAPVDTNLNELGEVVPPPRPLPEVPECLAGRFSFPDIIHLDKFTAHRYKLPSPDGDPFLGFRYLPDPCPRKPARAGISPVEEAPHPPVTRLNEHSLLATPVKPFRAARPWSPPSAGPGARQPPTKDCGRQDPSSSAGRYTKSPEGAIFHKPTVPASALAARHRTHRISKPTKTRTTPRTKGTTAHMDPSEKAH
ncbi:hypothetical protein DRE_07203 [Drechslerella stenobrocha 248]|uniref:Uncharacterized protein n=1 Tax=Drechslerella stenobrocha 248 TaxID=1043628 RepID=W7HJM8_9PEZI|nr:hypothetical protein DRE_07203 [Drechslerella stenobrocha 248]